MKVRERDDFGSTWHIDTGRRRKKSLRNGIYMRDFRPVQSVQFILSPLQEIFLICIARNIFILQSAGRLSAGMLMHMCDNTHTLTHTRFISDEPVSWWLNVLGAPIQCTSLKPVFLRYNGHCLRWGSFSSDVMSRVEHGVTNKSYSDTKGGVCELLGRHAFSLAIGGVIPHVHCYSSFISRCSMLEADWTSASWLHHIPMSVCDW